MWVFTLIFVFANMPSVTQEVHFASQQECETRRITIVADMPAAQTTPCTPVRAARRGHR